jgi:gamma-glutamyl:cysteine ligase YbdK (ATP-grasp superfamily)
MGQEIEHTEFSEQDFLRFGQRLARETRELRERVAAGDFSEEGIYCGLELETWLVGPDLAPAPANAAFLAALSSPLASAELAQYNVEFNTPPRALTGHVLALMRQDLRELLDTATCTAQTMGLDLVVIGILPTLTDDWLNAARISDLHRYHALNRQVLAARQLRPIRLDIAGREHIRSEHRDVMLEAATTSFQLHLQVPAKCAHRFYNAAILASAATVAVAANSPFLFGRDLWAETRIPLFEQAIDLGGYGEAGRGPLRRVGFGSGYARISLCECFEENLEHFPPLLAELYEEPPERFAHLRLHNGTIWRWNRPLVGFDADGRAHFRIEHRVLPAGPSLDDMVANAAFFYGLVTFLANDPVPQIPFSTAKDNFYQAARHGLEATVDWLRPNRLRLGEFVLEELLPQARRGLAQLGVDREEAEHFLNLVAGRVASGQTGAEWQRRFITARGHDFTALTRTYLHRQRSGEAVHLWPLP